MLSFSGQEYNPYRSALQMNWIYSSFLLLNKMDLQLTWAGFPTDGSTGAAQAASRTPSGDAAAGGAGAAADGAAAAADDAGAASVQPASRTPSGDAGWTLTQMCIIHSAIWCLMAWQAYQMMIFWEYNECLMALLSVQCYTVFDIK